MTSIREVRFSVVLVLSVAAAGMLAAGDALAKSFKSPSTPVSLVELYTSEGCSSCPAADAWLSGLLKRPGLWREFVPVAFHVTYWDYLGWDDRLASSTYTDRQRAYARSWGSGQVYTPGMVLNGKEWRAWRFAAAVPAPGAQPVGVLEVEQAADHQYLVTFSPEVGSELGWVGTIALLGFGISSDVSAGENTGRTLRHDFAVLDVVQGMLEQDEAGSFTGSFSLHPRRTVASQRGGVAAWVQREGQLKPVQATGGYL